MSNHAADQKAAFEARVSELTAERVAAYQPTPADLARARRLSDDAVRAQAAQDARREAWAELVTRKPDEKPQREGPVYAPEPEPMRSVAEDPEVRAELAGMTWAEADAEYRRIKAEADGLEQAWKTKRATRPTTDADGPDPHIRELRGVLELLKDRKAQAIRERNAKHIDQVRRETGLAR